MFAQDRQSTTPTSVGSKRSKCSRFALRSTGGNLLRVEGVTDCLRELFGVEGLGQKEHSIVDLVARLPHLLEITRNENNLGSRARFAQPISKRAAAHLRHDHVGKQKMNLPARILSDQGLSVIAIGSFYDLVTKVAKNTDRDVSHADVVLQHKNGFSTGRQLLSVWFLASGWRSGDFGKVNSRDGPFSFLALDANVAAALVHDAITGGEAETTAMVLCRKKRLEDMCLHFIAHAGAGVGDADQNIFAAGTLAA